jgi:hypothetical protein
MSQTVRMITVIGFVACGAPRTEEVATTTSLDDDKKTLRYVKEVLWPRSYREQDTALLGKILHDDFQMIDADGNLSDKAAELEWIQHNPWKVDSFRYDIQRLDVWPNGTAIVSGTGHMLSDSTESTYWSSNVFIKSDGTWRAVASQVSGVKEVK